MPGINTALGEKLAHQMSPLFLAALDEAPASDVLPAMCFALVATVAGRSNPEGRRIALKAVREFVGVAVEVGLEACDRVKGP